MRYITTVEGRELTIDVEQESMIRVDGVERSVDFVHLEGQTLVSILLGSSSYEAMVEARDGGYEVLLHGKLYTIRVEDERARRLASVAGATMGDTSELTLKAPMPGLIVSVEVEEGQEVAQGRVLVVLESMKMQNQLKAPRGGVVGRVRVGPGQSVEQGQPLVTIG